MANFVLSSNCLMLSSFHYEDIKSNPASETCWLVFLHSHLFLVQHFPEAAKAHKVFDNTNVKTRSPYLGNMKSIINSHKE